MAVLAKPSAMSGDNHEKIETKHEFDHFSDRQIQTRLLQVDEDYDQESYERRLSIQKQVKIGSRSQKSGVDDILGWFPDAKFVARRDASNKGDSKPRENFIHPWRDYRSKKDDTFVFKHYSDSKKYAEQYRNEHGCLNARYPSGGQLGEMRRLAFQASAPPQPTPGQISVQQLQQQQQQQQQQGLSCSSSPSHSASLHYTNRKEPGNYMAHNTSNCSCSKQTNHSDLSSQAHRYKLSPGQFSRTNTEIRCPVDSDNSSESGESFSQTRTPLRRISSATSTKSRHMTKSPTKITVPANPNPRAYPIQALTIQQNGLKSEVLPSPRPLDNLNCVAPEKQSQISVKRSSEDDNLGLSLRVQSLRDLLGVNEVPLRGYALPKSIPPQPNPENNMWFDANGRAYKFLHPDPELDGLTWTQKLEILRSVNKPAQKPKPKRTILKYIKDEPEDIFESEQEQLYEQRRIRHLVEQARTKGGKQFDWVFEAQVRARGINWGSDRRKHEGHGRGVGDGSGDSSDEEVTIETQKLGKYGIYVPPKKQQKVFVSQCVQKSKTFFEQ